MIKHRQHLRNLVLLTTNEGNAQLTIIRYRFEVILKLKGYESNADQTFKVSDFTLAMFRIYS